ncbi:MAG: ATP-dependent 6-phosphofructokinase [Cyanobacteria bacterium]|nr:ATP-dependent 6-phosphofructokinase [Cyanobacteriota bacterium]MDA1021553.1 ATP-dependent 6-phosphofructokinase [Cyanobacteriota bacterium]
MLKRIALMTSGGDAPGMNAFIRATTRYALDKGIEVFGILEGYQGMIDNQIKILPREQTVNIIQRGGTILKTSRSQEFMTEAGREKAAANLNALNIDGLICCGGDGSYAALVAFQKQWSGQMIGLPGTIDNDVAGTDFTIGFDTAVNTAVTVIDKLRDTGDAHSMHFIVEVMGRHCGDIAQAVGEASGAEYILIPETVSNLDEIYQAIQVKGHNIVVVAEGDELGGAYQIAKMLEQKSTSGKSFRVCILGHIQRGGSPTARDRILASSMGIKAVDALIAGESLKAVAEVNQNYILTQLG